MHTQAKPRSHRSSDDLFRHPSLPLGRMFSPEAVAVIGAREKEGSVGRTILENLRTGGFKGAIYPVNPKRHRILGLRAYPSIESVPQSIDLAIIATPAATVPGVVSECARGRVAGAVVISAGFKECGEAGAALEQKVQASRRTMRVIGPNCLGMMVPHTGLNATFAATMARAGSVGFISQSGALCTAILDWSHRANVGFSAFVSVGSMLDVGWGDLIYHLGDDPHTRSIIIYMESIGNARAFLSAAREVALTKPIIVIKVGRSEAAARAAASHTGSLTGADEVLDAAFRRAGVLRVNTISELFNMAEVLGKQPRPVGPRLAIVTNGGGPGALATDALIAGGGEIAGLSEEAFRSFNDLLPAHWSHGNPVDILGDASAERYGRAVEILARDPGNDGVLVILTPQAMTECAETARRLTAVKPRGGKPILASWMGGQDTAEGVAILNRHDIPTFEYPDTAARAFSFMWGYSRDLRLLYETPTLAAGMEDLPSRHRVVREIITEARKHDRTLLTEVESKQILSAYGIPVIETMVARSPEEAVGIAAGFGYPVVLKVHSHTVTHKSDAGGVKLFLRGRTAVEKAYKEIRDSVVRVAGAVSFHGVTVQRMAERRGCELIIGSSLDPQFGPVLLFGAGGHLVETFKDRTLALPPLNATLARRMMERTRIHEALRRWRDGSIDLDALEHLLVRFSQFVAEQRFIKEVDINPLLVAPGMMVALDARIILHDANVRESDLPPLAIRPYPVQFVTAWKLRDGTPVTIRPIRPEDEPLMVAFHKTLSEESVHFRYFGSLKLEQRVAHERLTRICFNDYDREIALVADHKSENGRHEILGVGRLSKVHGVDEAEFAIVISDQWQGKGLGTQFLKLLVKIGREEKLERIIGHILSDNRAMQRVSKKVGFGLRYDPAEENWRAEIAVRDS
ncbi:MAG TPA: bifunctional acetate--CoA ligase family protein/GNAT family N-acetyltransferase [Terrimicrobiaceae bacterium]